MKLSIEEILDKIEELKNLNTWASISYFMKFLDLTPEQMELLADHENYNVRFGLAENSNLTEELIIKFSCDEYGGISYEAFEEKLKNLNSLSSEDLESAYDLINNSKHIGRENFEKTFDYIANKFSEVSKLAKMFKRIILKGKKDLK